MEAATLTPHPAVARPAVQARTAVLVALVAIVALAAGLRLASFGLVPANPYYDAAVRSMGLSWHNFFYGAYEPGGQLAIDKAPVDLWFQVASVKLFGFSSTALRLPAVLSGIAAIPLLFDLVRRMFGNVAGLGAAAALAVLPIAVLNARSDTMDSVMMLLLVASGWLIVLGAERHRGWPVVAAGAVMGLAFNVKLFEALVALPALVVLAALAAEGPLRRRALQLAGAGVAFVGVSLSWVTLASLAPLGSRPFPIGSTNGGVWNVIFGFNGIDRLRGGPTAAVAAFDPTGPGRLFSTGGRGYGELIGAPLAAALLLGGLALAHALMRGGRLGRPPADLAARLRVAGVSYLATWLVVGYGLFSVMGRLQVRYLDAFTPAVAAVIGVAVAALVSARYRRGAAALALGVGVALCAAIATQIGGAPLWGAVLALLACAAAAVLAAVVHGDAARAPSATRGLLTLAALTAVLTVPLASSLRISGSSLTSAQRAGTTPAATVSALSGYLNAHQGSARYLTASTTVAKAAPLIIRDAKPVLMLTSLHGRPVLTPGQLAAKVRSGEVRTILLGRGACSSRRCAPVVSWARDHSTDVSRAAGLRPGTLSVLSSARTR